MNSENSFHKIKFNSYFKPKSMRSNDNTNSKIMRNILYNKNVDNMKYEKLKVL